MDSNASKLSNLNILHCCMCLNMFNRGMTHKSQSLRLTQQTFDLEYLYYNSICVILSKDVWFMLNPFH